MKKLILVATILLLCLITLVGCSDSTALRIVNAIAITVVSDISTYEITTDNLNVISLPIYSGSFKDNTDDNKVSNYEYKVIPAIGYTKFENKTGKEIKLVSVTVKTVAEYKIVKYVEDLDYDLSSKEFALLLSNNDSNDGIEYRTIDPNETMLFTGLFLVPTEILKKESLKIADIVYSFEVVD